MPPSACGVSPLAEGRACQRPGRRLYSRLTMQRQATPHGLSARITRDSPKERNIMPPSACDVSLRLRRVGVSATGERLYSRLTMHRQTIATASPLVYLATLQRRETACRSPLAMFPPLAEGQSEDGEGLYNHLTQQRDRQATASPLVYSRLSKGEKHHVSPRYSFAADQRKASAATVCSALINLSSTN